MKAVLNPFSKYIIEMKSFTLPKLLLILGISAPLTIALEFINKYVYNDWNFLSSLLVLIFIDTILGFAKDFKTKTISSSGFGMVIIKVTLYFTALVTVHVLTTYTVNGNHPGILDYSDDFVMTSLMLREAISIFENIAAINPEIIPKWILKKLKDFDSATGEKIDNDGAGKQQ